jgi:hypothetical protein
VYKHSVVEAIDGYGCKIGKPYVETQMTKIRDLREFMCGFYQAFQFSGIGVGVT